MTSEMHPQRWGDPAAAVALPDTARGLVELAFGGIRDTSAVVAPADELPSLDEALLDGLRAVVGAEHVLTDTAIRALAG